MRITSVSHASTLPWAFPSPSHVRTGDTSLLVGPGIVRLRAGSGPEVIAERGHGVMVDAGVDLDDAGSLLTFGGHAEENEWGSSDEVINTSAPSAAMPSLPFPRRGLLAVPHGKKTVLFGGLGPDSKPTTTVWLYRDGDVRALKVRLPAAGAYMQAGRIGKDRLFLLGSAAEDWQTGRAFDMLATIDSEGRPVIGLHEPLDPQGARHGVMVAQDGPDAFFIFGGKSDRNASMTLWHYSEEFGTRRVGDVVLGETPWNVAYGAAWVDEGGHVVLAGGTRYQATGGFSGATTAVAEDRVIRVEVERS